MSDVTPTPETEPKRRSFVGWFGFILLLVGVIGAGGFAISFSSILSRPAIFDDNTSIIIKPGAGRVVISAILNRSGVEHPMWVMRLEELRRGKTYIPKAGEFALPKGTSLSQALDIIHQGKSIQHSFTIPEGWTTAQVIDALYDNERLDGILTPMPAEGTILPETYYYTIGADRNEMVARFQEKQELAFAELWSSRQEGLPIKTMGEAIILASIVEKETGLAAEQGKVASVFINRLRIKMKLQSDPTTLYGLIKAGEGVTTLKRSHLKHPSPWNTYAHKGLPPTPIANPGLESFAAVMNPEETDFLYFVADGTGGHKFAKTLDEHNKNVRAWRKIRDSKTP